MRIVIPYRVIEENTECVKEYDEWYPYADNLEYEFSVDDVKIDYSDLEDIVEEYLDDILEILQKRYKKKLSELKKADSGKF
ncbi:hypothetical protein [Sulfurisphaera tokodaii]|uniref:Uncharacterized protein n=2 Tax=Sulfurisphaera tokodaii TaxID=111955 RepID=F9VNR6_SULTO|nr:hypothetical protein [Sulfurisphaera tokodaii]BAK54424.1 hypothetical protein STK_09546 [Sulfurisphaera tokodaii str. 7]HII73931.1 hypothetical protein [Sulfurisphaera tokodaii]